jgi:hypothetical protein
MKFRKNELPPSSISKGKPSMKQTASTAGFLLSDIVTGLTDRRFSEAALQDFIEFV